MATRAHRKTKRLRFDDDATIIPIHDIYPGERYVDNLKSTIKQAKIQSQKDWLASDGTATTYCNDRPVTKLVHIEHTERSIVEQEEWNQVLERSAKAARVRAIQLHFHVHSNLRYALPLTYSPTARQPAQSVPQALTVMSKAENGRSWIYDTGCHATSIGWKHLTPEEKKRVHHVETKGFITGSGQVWTNKAVHCYVPFLGKRKCYVLDDCPPILSVNEEVDDHGAIFIWTQWDGPVARLADGIVAY